MSLIKAHIEDLRKRAEGGEEEARRTLEEAGLWPDDEGEVADEEAAWEATEEGR
ncbi:MAG TPA: hypothetical protein VGB98_25815 [Pyrinomonadaceae bacterium]|jgi:hypothetical protein